MRIYRTILASFGFVILASLIYVAAPPPHRALAQFVGQQTYGGTGAGTANAQTFTIANMVALLPGVQMTYIPGVTNTGPATINISSIGAVAVRRPSSIGLVALSGGELQIGILTTVVYDGTNVNIVGPVDTRPIGDTMEFRGSSTPTGYLIEDGSCVSQTTYAPLFSVISTTYGSCSAGLFALPDSRGTMFAALDNQGANGSAGRITNAGSGCTATSVVLCGGQNTTIVQSGLPNITFSKANTNLTDPGHTHTLTSTTSATAGTNNNNGGGGGSFSAMGATQISGTNSSFTGISIPLNGNVTQTTTTTLNPILIGRRAIKY